MTKQEKRQQARKALHDASLTRHGAYDIATYFIETTSWANLIRVYEDMKERGVCD